MPEATQPEPKERVKYIVFGCGSIGYKIVEELTKEGDRIFIVDGDEKRVAHLRDQKYEAVVRTISDPAMVDGLPIAEIAFVLTSDRDANLVAVKTIRRQFPAIQIMARAVDPVSGGLLQAAGADFILNPQEVVAKAAVQHIKKLHATRLSKKLFTLLSGWEGTLGIITHKNPDPDAISSAIALASIARHANPKKLATRIFYEGNIGHQENRTFVNLLDIRMEHATPALLAECRYLAMVDCAGPGINNDIRPETRINIILDHHKIPPVGTGGPAVEFQDIRPGMGATASILTQYLEELDIPVDRKVATALLYGIRSDTKDFRRNTTPQDMNYAAYLLPLTDNDLLDKIMSPSISQETLDILGSAIQNRKIRSGYLFANVGYIRNRDALPQAADLLINLEGVNTAIVYGITDTAIVLSARNRDVRLHLGNVLSEAFGDMGTAGGHPNMAAATLPLTFFSKVKDKDELLKLVIDPILESFANIVGLDNENQGEN
ncbi:MAG: DHH family phosphoesterase [Methanoregulaceae archaeon]